MSEARGLDVERDSIHARAAEWFIRLDDPNVSLEETIEWQHWMEADARHQAAFARMEEVGKELQRMPRPDINSPNEATAPSTRFTVLSPQGSHWRWLAAAASVVLIAGLTYWLPRSGEVLQTAVGENRTMNLPDGSTVTLGGDTHLRIAFSNEQRQIELTRGEAFFTVAQDPQRPFRVESGNASVTAIGTAFNVRLNQDRVLVAVVAGRVAVEQKSSPISIAWLSPKTAPSVPLNPGQQASVDARKGVALAPVLPDPNSATAWRSGRQTFRGEPLRYVVEDVNRYADKPLVIEDETVGELRFTGTVLNDNVVGWTASLDNVFGVEAIEEAERILLRKKE